MDAGDEEVGAWVDCTVILGRATLVLGRTAGRCQKNVSVAKAKDTDRLSAWPLPLGDAERRGPPRGLSLRRVGRGDALRSRS